MGVAAQPDPRVHAATVTDELITFHLADGRVVSVPLFWSWRLERATPSQRKNYEIIGTGQGVHWPDIDEDLSVRVCFTEFLPGDQRSK